MKEVLKVIKPRQKRPRYVIHGLPLQVDLASHFSRWHLILNAFTRLLSGILGVRSWKVGVLGLFPLQRVQLTVNMALTVWLKKDEPLYYVKTFSVFFFSGSRGFCLISQGSRSAKTRPI